MSCEDCEKALEETKAGMRGPAFYHWKNANVVVICCDKHLREIFDALSFGQGQKQLDKETPPPTGHVGKSFDG